MTTSENATSRSIDTTEMESWLNSLPADRKLFIASQYRNGYDAGLTGGTEKADREIRLNRILIPLSIAALVFGVLGQRYLHLIN